MTYSVPFTFDAGSGVVTGPVDSQPGIGKPQTGLWTICEHLRPHLDAQLSGGSQIAYVTGAGAWSRIDLDVSLKQVNASVLPAADALTPGIEFWSNIDPHYPVQSGLVCAACRQTISWPTV